MAILWVRHSAGRQENPSWSALFLNDACYGHPSKRNESFEICTQRRTDEACAWSIKRFEIHGSEKWILFVSQSCAAKIRVNAIRTFLGIKALQHRDEIFLQGFGRLFFSTDQKIVPQRYQGEGEKLRCPRCQGFIQPNQYIVRCPACSSIHHQDAENQLTCWTYADVCGACHDQPTHLDGEFSWTPENL
ncbi:MAG: hypothetical protein JXR73_21305 [Candidatus Omnitrophica bacterium]|nr:hypothetical protein [Candidatus Omnitrophota bacterium]